LSANQGSDHFSKKQGNDLTASIAKGLVDSAAWRRGTRGKNVFENSLKDFGCSRTKRHSREGRERLIIINKHKPNDEGSQRAKDDPDSPVHGILQIGPFLRAEPGPFQEVED
jgi:hypothetical protein